MFSQSQIFPFGQYTKHQDSYFCPCNKTAITIGEENINLFNILDEDKYGHILKREDLDFLLNELSKLYQQCMLVRDLLTDTQKKELDEIKKTIDNEYKLINNK